MLDPECQVNELLSRCNEFHSEYKWRVFEMNQFHSTLNEFDAECNEFDSESNEFFSECN